MEYLNEMNPNGIVYYRRFILPTPTGFGVEAFLTFVVSKKFSFTMNFGFIYIQTTCKLLRHSGSW